MYFSRCILALHMYVFISVIILPHKFFYTCPNLRRLTIYLLPGDSRHIFLFFLLLVTYQCIPTRSVRFLLFLINSHHFYWFTFLGREGFSCLNNVPLFRIFFLLLHLLMVTLVITTRIRQIDAEIHTQVCRHHGAICVQDNDEGVELCPLIHIFLLAHTVR